MATCLAEHQGDRQTAFGGLLVLRVHFLGCQRHRVDGRVEVDATVGWDLVARDHESRPRLDGAERATLDTGDLHETRNRVTGHPQVMLERGFRGVCHHLMAEVARLGDQCGAHGGRYTDLRLAAAFRSGESGVVFAEIADRRSREQSVPEFLLRQLPAAFTKGVDQRGKDARGSACGRRDYEMAARVLFRSRKGIRRHYANPR